MRPMPESDAGAAHWIAVLDRVPHAVIVLSPVREHAQRIDFLIDHPNLAACGQLALPRPELVGRRLSTIPSASPLLNACSQALESERGIESRTNDLVINVDASGAQLVLSFRPLTSDLHPAQELHRQLEEQNAHLKAVYAAMSDGVVVFDPSGRAIFVNDAEARLTGFENAADLQQNLAYFERVFELRALDGSLLPVAEWPVSRILRGERLSGLELVTRRKDTEREWVIRFSGEPVFDAHGQLLLAIVVSSDVTGRVRREQALRASEERLRLALETARAGFLDFDISGREPPLVSEGLKRCFGIEAQQSTRAEDYMARVHPDDRERVRLAVRNTIASEGELYIEFRVRSQVDGEESWLAWRARVARSSPGHSAHFTGVVLDITERKRSEEALQALADSMPQLVWSANASGTVDYYNARASEYAGIERLPDGTWTWQPVLHPDDLQPTIEAWHRAVSQHEPYSCEHRVLMRDGSFRWHVSRARMVQQPGSRRWYGTATDIHEQKLAEEQLRIAIETRDQVISFVSHDLRSPLSVLRTSHYLLHKVVTSHPELEARQRAEGSLRRSDRQIGKMEKLLNELLDVARLQAGQPLDLAPSSCDLVALVREVVDEQLAAAPNHEIELEAPIPSLNGTWDAARIERVMSNLLSNAVKYSPGRGRIRVLIEPGEQTVTLRVTDRGVGIHERDRDRIFEWFARGENAASTARGIGIGLAGARHIVEQHGGSLSVESELGVGSTFSVSLPLRTKHRGLRYG